MLLQQALNGLALGSVYVLFSLGFTLIFGVQRVLNLAHGAIFTWGALSGLFAVNAGLPLYVAFPIAVMAGGLLGILIELLVFRQMRKQNTSEFGAIVATIGAGMILTSVAQIASNTQILRFPFGTFPFVLFEFAGLRISLLQITMIAMTAALVLALLWLIYYTYFGKQLRAVSVSEKTAGLLGINPGAIYLKTFFISGLLAGAAGFAIGVAFNSVHFLMGEPFLLRALVIVVLGGLGSVWGAVFAGLFLGVMQTMIVATPYSGLSDAIIFGALFLILLFRPQGLLGKKEN